MVESNPGLNPIAQRELNMRGNEKVIALLNEALKEELTSINQYFIHAEMCENWGFEKLGGSIRKLSIVEMKHAEALIERILFLDGIPKMDDLLSLNVGQNVKTQIENDLKLELHAVAMYNAAAQKAVEADDNASRELFTRLLKDEEAHTDWFETQLHMIKEMGIENYLAQQV